MENKIEHFNFYKNYYDIIKYLNKEDKLLIMNAILEYMFEDKEPKLAGLNKGIWNNIKMPLDTTKKKIINGKKGGAPINNSNAKKQPKIKLKTTKDATKKQTNNISISNFLFLFSNININNNRNKIEELFKEYLELRQKQKYVVSETVIIRLINKLNEYGKNDRDKIEVIQNAINGAWKDFYPLKKASVPEWFDEEIKEDVDDETRQKAEAIRNGTYKP